MKTIEPKRQFSLVKLTPAEAGEVMTLQRAAYATEAQIYGDPFLPALTQSLTEVEEELQGFSLGVRLDARLVGAVRWTVEAGVAHIGRLTVAPDMQGQGLGTRLLRAAEQASEMRAFCRRRSNLKPKRRLKTRPLGCRLVSLPDLGF